jgi:endoglucanase
MNRLLPGLMALVLCVGGCGHPPAQEDYVPLRHPFRGATLYQDGDIPAAYWQHTHDATWLDPIVNAPQARWLTGPDSLADLPPTLRQAHRQGALLVLVAYNIPDRDCGGASRGGAADASTYDAWISELVTVLGSTRTVVILEPDAVAAECFDDARAAMLAGAVRKLAGAGHSVYLDAGHPRWRDPDEMADRLREAGVAGAEGFSVNVANRQSTADSHRYAVDLSRRLGGREAIIDTSRNGLDAPPDDQWCNSARQALGQPPTTDPGLDRVAALLWVKSPGESDGTCGGGPEAGQFWPRQAQALIVNSPWVPESARRRAAAARLPLAVD